MLTDRIRSALLLFLLKTLSKVFRIKTLSKAFRAKTDLVLPKALLEDLTERNRGALCLTFLETRASRASQASRASRTSLVSRALEEALQGAREGVLLSSAL